MIFAVLAAGAGAQGIQRTRTALDRSDGPGRARVEVVEEPDAARAVAAADATGRIIEIDGYRVSLFRDNKQSSGDDARSVAAQFKERFPGIPVQVVYKSPYFAVTAGAYSERVDAIALWGKALPHFRKAVVVEEKITVADIISQQRALEKEAEKEALPEGL